MKISTPKKNCLYYRKQQQKWCYDKQLVHITVILRSKNIFSSLESFQRLQLLNMHLVNFELSFHLFRDLFYFCILYTKSTVGSILVKCLIFQIYNFCRIFILYHITFLAHLAKGHVNFCHQVSSIVNFSHYNLLLRNHWTNLDQTLLEWSLDGPLPKLCPVIPTSNQDGRQAKNRKKRGIQF